jgi:sugar phosphate isomerase/epimerase
MRFALSTHLFHAERLERRHLETIAGAGFTEVEIFATRSHVDYHDRGRIHELRGWLDDLGLAAGSMHGPICDSFAGDRWGTSFSIASADAARRQAALDEMRAALEAARVLGCAHLVVHLGLPDAQPIPPGDNDTRALARSLDALGPMAADAGVGLALELIPNALSTAAALEALLDAETAPPGAGVCLDLGHAHIMDGVADAVERLGGVIVTTHVHDNNGREDAHLVPFQGAIDWPAALAALWKVGYTGALVFEVAGRGDAPGVLGRTVGARDRLRAILDDLAAPFAFAEE